MNIQADTHIPKHKQIQKRRTRLINIHTSTNVELYILNYKKKPANHKEKCTYIPTHKRIKNEKIYSHALTKKTKDKKKPDVDNTTHIHNPRHPNTNKKIHTYTHKNISTPIHTQAHIKINRHKCIKTQIHT